MIDGRFITAEEADPERGQLEGAQSFLEIGRAFWFNALAAIRLYPVCV